MATESGDTSDTSLKARLRAAYPQIFVGDMARAVAFYRDRLGFAVRYLYGEPPFYGHLWRDGAGLNLRHMDTPVIDPPTRECEILLSAYIPVDRVETLFREFETARVDFAQSLQRKPWGTIEFIVRDPDGNLLCFASP